MGFSFRHYITDMARSERSSQCCAEGRGYCFKLGRVPVPNALALQCAQAFMARVADVDMDVCPPVQGGAVAGRRCHGGRLTLAWGIGHALTPNEQEPPRAA